MNDLALAVSASCSPRPARPGECPTAATEEDTLVRLACWLADVAAEAALEATSPEASPTLERPVAESAS
jgi:hypothetical protein